MFFTGIVGRFRLESPVDPSLLSTEPAKGMVVGPKENFRVRFIARE